MNWETVFVIAFVLAIGLYFKSSYSNSDYKPLKTDPNDPLLIKAIEAARASIERFRILYNQPHEHALIKFRFITNTDKVEHLWAEVLEWRVKELQVLIATPPADHKGHLEREHICDLEDIEDWHLRDDSGNEFGGYTQTALIKIAERDGIKLPKELFES